MSYLHNTVQSNKIPEFFSIIKIQNNKKRSAGSLRDRKHVNLRIFLQLKLKPTCNSGN